MSTVPQPSTAVPLDDRSRFIARRIAAVRASMVGEAIGSADTAEQLATAISDANAHLRLLYAAESGAISGDMRELAGYVRSFRDSSLEVLAYESGCRDKWRAGDPGWDPEQPDPERYFAAQIDELLDEIGACETLLEVLDGAAGA